jgi:hypothetical protein
MKMNNGDIVIIGKFGRAISEMAAIVTNVHQNTCNCQYLSEKQNDCPVIKRHSENLTLITDFGVRLVIEGYEYVCAPQDDLECIAKYLDGRPRSWQEDPDDWFFIPLSSAAREIMSDQVKESAIKLQEILALSK